MQSRFLVFIRFMMYSFAIITPVATTHAETISFECEEEQFNGIGTPSDNRKMTISYIGQDVGTVKMSTFYGDIELPANLHEADRDVDGKKIHVLGFSASGKAEVLMPPKSAMETCIADGAKRDALALSPDTLTYYAVQCRSKVKNDPKPISANVKVELGFTDQDGNVFITRTYEEPSTVVGGNITLDNSPPPNCKLVSRN